MGIFGVRPIIEPSSTQPRVGQKGALLVPAVLLYAPCLAHCFAFTVFSFFFHSGEILYRCSVNRAADERKPAGVQAE